MFEKSGEIKKWGKKVKTEKVKKALLSTVPCILCVHCGCLMHTNIVMPYGVSLPNFFPSSKEWLGWKCLSNGDAKEENYLSAAGMTDLKMS